MLLRKKIQKAAKQSPARFYCKWRIPTLQLPQRALRVEFFFLPFDGDNLVSVILSKAFLLAEDRKIKDPTIMSQILKR
jgi:hypothetical protein